MLCNKFWPPSRYFGKFWSRGFCSVPYHYPTIVTKLFNGIRVASQRTFDETVTVGVCIGSGSRYENQVTNGAAHFLEHMTFKGTKKRSRVQLEKEIEDLGAHLNAYTAREQTVYYAKTFPNDVKQTMDILGDILINSNVDEYSMDLERHVILREMEEVEKVFEEVIFDKLHYTAFKDSSLGFTILGTRENIENMKRHHLLDYIKKNYTADRMVIVASGNINHKELVTFAENFFSKITVADKSASVMMPVKPKFYGGENITRDSNANVAHVAAAFEGVPWKSPDAIMFMLMQSIIGSYRRNDDGFSSNKIFSTMNFGRAEIVSAFNTCYSDTGLFGIYVQCDAAVVDSCMNDLMLSIPALPHSINDEDVSRARLQLKTQLFGSLDTTTAIAEDIGRQLLVYGRKIPIGEFLKRLDAIDAEQIRRVAWRYFSNAEIAVAGLGPIETLKDYKGYRRCAG